MLEILSKWISVSNTSKKTSFHKSDNYSEIIEADYSRQLWPLSGHFYPDCSATPIIRSGK